MAHEQSDREGDVSVPTVNRRSVLVAPRQSALVEAPVPVFQRGEVLVRVLLNGVCASELPVWEDGGLAGSPSVLGHEPVGTVVAVGSGVTTVAIGDLVTGRFAESFAELVVAREEDAVVVPDGLSPESAIGEPLGCVVEAVRRSRLDVDDRVAVVGLGFMGLCLLQLLTVYNVGGLVGIDTRQEALRRGLRHGAATTCTPSQVSGEIGMVDGYDVVFEATGMQSGLDLATSLVRAHGTLSIVGYHQGPRVIDMRAWNWKAIDVVNGHVRDGRLLANSTRDGLALVAGGRLEYPSLVTHWYSFADIDQAFRDLQNKSAEFVKAVVRIVDSSNSGRQR